MIKSPEKKINPYLNKKVKSIPELENYVGRVLNSLEKKKLFYEDFNFLNAGYNKIRPSVLKQSKAESYGLINHPVIEPYSSDDDCHEECDEILKEPSVKEVCEYIFDQNTLMKIENKNFPKGVKNGLLFKNIDNDMTALEIKNFLQKCPILERKDKLDIYEIRIFNVKYITFAFVLFSKKEDCEKIHNFFNDPYKLKNCPTLNSNGCIIEISYCYDLTDLKNSEWYAVVLRNLDPKCTCEKIENFCKTLNQGVLYALPPFKIFTSYCSIVVMNELDDAEKLSILLNSRDLREISNDRKIKAHLHPKCSKFRPNPMMSHFSAFFKSKSSSVIHVIKKEDLLDSIQSVKNNSSKNSVKYSPCNSQKNLDISNELAKSLLPNLLSTSLPTNIDKKEEENKINIDSNNGDEDKKIEILSKLISSRDSMLVTSNISTPSSKKKNKVELFPNKNKNIKKPVNFEDFIESKIERLKTKKLSKKCESSPPVINEILSVNEDNKDNEINKLNSPTSFKTKKNLFCSLDSAVPNIPLDIKNNQYVGNKRNRENDSNKCNNGSKQINKSSFNPHHDTIPLGTKNESKSNPKYYSDLQKMSKKSKK